MFGETWTQIADAAWHGLLTMLLNPLLYIGLGLTILEVLRAGRHERRFFGVRVSHPWATVWRRYLNGLVVGMALSIGLTVGGVFVSPWETWVTVVACVVLGFGRVRWVSLPYAVALLTALSQFASHYRPQGLNPAVDVIWSRVASYHSTAWLLIASAGLVGEAALLWLMRNQPAAPTVVTSKRGRTIGAHLVHSGLVLPFLTLSPGLVGLPTGTPHWWPLMSHGAAGFTMTGGVFLGGVSGVVSTQKPRTMVTTVALSSLITGVLSAAMVYVAYRYNLWLLFVSVAMLVLGREWPLWLVRRVEHRGEPLTVPSTQGVRILAVQPGSLAETMGIRPLEVITQVNQIPVHTNYDLYFAMDQNPAYARLNVLDERGEIRIVGKPIYAGEKNKLGLILAPEGHERDRYVKPVYGLFHTLFLRRIRHEGPSDYYDMTLSDAEHTAMD